IPFPTFGWTADRSREGGAGVVCQPCSTSYFTVITPALWLAMVLNAAGVRSRQRLATNGPRSLIRTTTDLPLLTFVTLTRVLNGRVLCAGVKSLTWKISPLAVRLPSSV